MAWIIGGAILGGTLLSSAMQSDAAGDAAGEQRASTEKGIDEQRRQYDLTRLDTAPWRAAGSSAVMDLVRRMGLPVSIGGDQAPAGYPNVPKTLTEFANDLRSSGKYTLDPGGQYVIDSGAESGYPQYGTRDPRYDDEAIWREAARLHAGQQAVVPTPPTPKPGDGDLTRKFSIDDFWKDPVTQLSYQFGLDEGRKALSRAAPLTTGVDSGAALKELTKFGTDYAATRAGDSYNRFENDKTSLFNKLAGIAGIGQTSANTVAQAGMNTGNNVSQMLTAQGNANAASRIGQANAWTGGLNSIANWWQGQNTLDRVFPRGAPGGGRGSNPTPWYGGQELGQSDFGAGYY